MRGNVRIVKVLVLIFCLCLLSPNLYLLAFEVEPKPPTVSMDFQDANLKDVLKIFSIQSGLNFIASEAVRDRKITLYLDNVPLDKTMDKLFAANNLTYELDKDSNIFIVKDLGTPKTETVTKIFYLKHATVSSSSLKEEMSNYMKSSEGEQDEGSVEGGKWSMEKESGITSAVKKLLSENGSVMEDFRTNSLIVTDTPRNIEVITRVIASLDISIPQVLLEVEMLDVSKNVVDKLGVDWPTTLLSFTVPGSRETKFPFGSKGTSGSGRTLDPDAGVFGGPGSTGWDFGAWDATHFGPSILTVLGATLTLDFLRTQTDTKFLARPKLLTLNNEPAEIRIATSESIGIKTTSSGPSGGIATTSTEAERTETGVVLRVTPQINSETGEVTMFIYPKVAEAVGGNTITSAGNSYVFRDPEERSTKSMVRVKDGETVVIGGLIREEKYDVEEKLPILGDIPLLGALFRHKGGTSDKNKERELLVFITPHIMKDNINDVKLVQNKTALPKREQGVVSGISREVKIKNSLDKFERE